MTTLQIKNDKNEDRGATKGDAEELNINDVSTLSSFKSTIFPQLQPKRPQGIKSFLVIIFRGKGAESKAFLCI